MNPWKTNYKSDQGNVGLGRAIDYYTSYGISSSLPLNDTQKYDLIVDKNNKLQRVSVKTTSQLTENKKYYRVQLKNSGGASGKCKVRKFNNTSCDILFILTMSGTMYEIPSNLVNVGSMLTLNQNWDNYIVNINHP